MDRIPRLTAEQRADLTAYLDGELGDEETRAIEQTLAASEVARHDVEMLTRTWDLLDALARPAASPDFATKTIASLKVETVSAAPSWRPQVDRALVWLGWATWISAAGVAGFAVGHRLLPDRSDPLVRDLPLLEKLELYRDVGSVEFLQALDRQPLPAPPAGGAGGLR